MEKLSNKEIQRRLQQLRNYEKLYPKLQEKYKSATQQLREQDQKITEQDQQIETLKLQIEELRVMVFGKKKNKDDDDDPYTPKPKKNQIKKRKKRSKSSFRRRVPLDTEVTEEQYHSIDTCPDCNEPLHNIQEVTRFEEDMVIPALENLTKVIKHRIETGFCSRCRKQHSAILIAKQMCSVGENVRTRIVYCINILKQTVSDTKTDLRDTFGIEVSNGEIINILTEQALKLLPEYHNINATIRGSPAKHCDETGWKVQTGGEGNHAWVKRASDSRDTIFLMGRSRGKGNAKALHDEAGQPTVTDDYGAYDFLGESQALCWAHPKRKFKDVAKSSVFSTQRQQHCNQFYQSFCVLLKDVQQVVESPYLQTEREQAAKRFRRRIAKLCQSNLDDPKKLATLKATFLERKERYLLCILLPHIPMTNNAAEQALRPLVIKRKLSFGSKTQKGADVMSILMSVCFTHWWRIQDQAKSSWRESMNFYEVYQGLLRQWQPG